MRKQSRYTVSALLVVAVALTALAYVRWKAPPEIARILPESDAIIFINLKPLRAATHFDRTEVSRSASYQQFIAGTGILVERDLDEVAFALHRMSNPNGANGPVAFSEVFQGRFDRERVERYLNLIASTKETYAGRSVFSIPSEGRTLRVAILGYDMIAASNMPTPEQIHSIVDRFVAGASPFSGSSLLAARYSDVPSFSSVWGIGHIGLPLNRNGHIEILGVELPIASDATLVASAQGSKLRIEELTGSAIEAERAVGSLRQILKLVQSIEAAQQPLPRTAEDKAIQSLIGSVQVTQKNDRVEVSATLPVDAVRSLWKQ